MSSSEDPYRLDLLGGVASLPTEKEAAEIATLEALLPVVAPMLGPEHLTKHINVSTKINGGCVLPGLQKAIEVATATIPDFNFWEKTLPRIIAATRTIPALFPEGCIRILPKNKLCSDNGDTTDADGGGGTVVAGPLFRTSTSFTRDQIFALLAASFLHRLPYGKDKDTFGSITWLSLMMRSSFVGVHRLACLMCYFHTYNPHGSDTYHGEEKVVFERVSGNGGGKAMSVKSLLQLTTTPVIPKATTDATSNIVGTMTITSKIRIEDVELADAIVDFANKQPSIGEIIPSATQEEVLFSIKPESMISMVIFEELEPAEVGIVYGSQRYCNYTGYMDTFRFHSPYPPLEDGGGRGGGPAAMIVMDAMVNRGKAEVRDEWFERDLLKAYLGFSSIRCIPRRGSSGSVEQTTAHPLIVTGGWGCGMFGCNQGLKFLQQAIVASLAGVRLVYTTFGSNERAAQFTRMAATLEARGTSVAEAMGWVQEFARDGNLRHDQFEEFLAAKLK